MKTSGCLVFAVLCTCIYIANAQDEQITKLEDVIEAIEYGEQKLKEFRQRNPQNIGALYDCLIL